jgi:hypothetical protein
MLRPSPSSEDPLAQAVVASHVRSLLVAHLVDVESSDKHTVKPWFTGKLDYAPPVKDLAADGIALIGGRLDYVGQRPVAALVYRIRNHTVNLFVWPSAIESPEDPQVMVRQGFNLIQWRAGGMQFWAISDVNIGELQTFVRLLGRTEPLSGNANIHRPLLDSSHHYCSKWANALCIGAPGIFIKPAQDRSIASIRKFAPATQSAQRTRTTMTVAFLESTGPNPARIVVGPHS